MKSLHKTDMMISALKGDERILISKADPGSKCGCVCIACHRSVVAKNKEPRKISKFFSHAVVNPECNYSHETDLHWAAKKIICEMSEIWVPEDVQRVNAENYVLKAEFLKIDYAKSEVVLGGDIKADVLIHSGEEKIGIEVYVTHPLDSVKLEKYKALNISVLEINLSGTERTIMEDDLRKILEGELHKKWEYHVLTDRHVKEPIVFVPVPVPPASTPAPLSVRKMSTDKPTDVLRKVVESSSRVEPVAVPRTIIGDYWSERKGVETRPIVYRNSRWVCEGCPKKHRLPYGRPYADFDYDCCKCEYFKGLVIPRCTSIYCNG